MSAMPRVNSSMLLNYKGKTVRIQGKVLKLEGETATIECSDNGQVVVKLNRDSHFADDYVEVIGRVTGDTTVQELMSTNMGNELDMAGIEKLTQLSHQLPHIFHGESGGDQGGY